MSRIVYKNKKIQELIILAQNGEIKALEELIKRNQKHIFAIYSHLVERTEDISDLTQEALLKMAKSITQLKDPNKFHSWLNQIITNLYYDFAKKNPNKFIEFDEKVFSEIKDKLGCEPGERCFFSELEKLIRKALLTLPIDLRITIVLREYEGLSYDAISKITNTTVGTVKSRISRARLKLQNELKEFI